jgi:hypothetical protein
MPVLCAGRRALCGKAPAAEPFLVWDTGISCRGWNEKKKAPGGGEKRMARQELDAVAGRERALRADCCIYWYITTDAFEMSLAGGRFKRAKRSFESSIALEKGRRFALP